MLRGVTIYVDTGLGECKDLESSIISERDEARDIFPGSYQTQHYQIIREPKCLFLYPSCPKSEYHGGDGEAREYHKENEVKLVVNHISICGV